MVRATARARPVLRATAAAVWLLSCSHVGPGATTREPPTGAPAPDARPAAGVAPVPSGHATAPQAAAAPAIGGPAEQIRAPGESSAAPVGPTSVSPPAPSAQAVASPRPAPATPLDAPEPAPSAAAPQTVPPPPPPVIAVVCGAAAERDEWLADVLRVGLAARLAAVDSLRPLDAEEVAEAAADLDLSATRLAETAGARRLARVVGADIVVTALLRTRGTRYEARLALSPRSGDVRRATVAAATAFELDAAVAGEVSRMLDLPADALEVGMLTADAEAYEGFGRALSSVLKLLDVPAPARRAAWVRRQLVQARSQLQAAAELDPGLGPARAAAAVASALLGDERALGDAVEQSGAPVDPRGLPLAVRAYVEAGDAAAAASLLAVAATTHPASAAICAQRARVALERGRFGEAAVQLAACHELVPRDAWLLAQRSRALAALGKRDEAIRASERAREEGGDAPRLVGEVAARYLEVGRAEDALRLLIAAVHAQPGAVRLRVLLARAYMLDGRDIDAVTEGERAIKRIDQADRETRVLAYLTLAHAWARLGQYDVAIEQLAIGRRYGLTSLTEIESDPKLVRFRADPRYPWGK